MLQLDELFVEAFALQEEERGMRTEAQPRIICLY